MKKLRGELIYNAYTDAQPDARSDTGSLHYRRQMIRGIARGLRRLRHEVVVMPLAGDLSVLQRKLSRMSPDVVFNQYDDVVHGALYEMRVAAFIRMLGYPMTGSPALGLGLSRYKYMSLSLLMGAGLPIPLSTAIVERLSDIDEHKWTFPVIVHAAQEHAGIGLARDSVVETKTALKEKAHPARTKEQSLEGAECCVDTCRHAEPFCFVNCSAWDANGGTGIGSCHRKDISKELMARWLRQLLQAPTDSWVEGYAMRRVIGVPTLIVATLVCVIVGAITWLYGRKGLPLTAGPPHTISWNGAAHAEHYTLKCGTESRRYTLPPVIVRSPTTSFAVRVVASRPGAYFCVVTAGNAAGESDPSSEITFVIR